MPLLLLLLVYIFKLLFLMCLSLFLSFFFKGGGGATRLNIDFRNKNAHAPSVSSRLTWVNAYTFAILDTRINSQWFLFSCLLYCYFVVLVLFLGVFCSFCFILMWGRGFFWGFFCLSQMLFICTYLHVCIYANLVAWMHSCIRVWCHIELYSMNRKEKKNTNDSLFSCLIQIYYKERYLTVFDNNAYPWSSHMTRAVPCPPPPPLEIHRLKKKNCFVVAENNHKYVYKKSTASPLGFWSGYGPDDNHILNVQVRVCTDATKRRMSKWKQRILFLVLGCSFIQATNV